jgi:hypothetical protein
VCSKSFHFHYLAFKLLGFCSAFVHVTIWKTIFPHLQWGLPYIKVSHPDKTVVTITVLKAELLDLIAEGGSKEFRNDW